MEEIAISNSLEQHQLVDDDITNNTNRERKPDFKQRITAKFCQFLVFLKKKLIAMKRVFKETETSNRITRTYHVWPGNNVFFFHGRLIFGPDPRGLLLTTTSIIISSWMFIVYIGDDLGNHFRLIIAISVFLTITALVSLILVSGTDPGIIPRNDGEMGMEECVDNGDGIRRKRVMVNGVEVKLKYCGICKIFRPPRSCHCVICNNCVERFDHHCPWIGQCIALRNCRFYMMFVVSALTLFAYIFSFSVRRLHQSGTGLSGMLKNHPETLALVLFSSAAIWFLGSLAIFHVYLLATNQTAYENFRQSFVGLGSRNPYNKGIVRNIKEVLFVTLSPSRVDFRAEVRQT